MMNKLIQKFDNPWLTILFTIVLTSVIYHTLALTIISYSRIGLILSVVMPILVGTPLAFIFHGYIKTIKAQKIKLEELNDTNKKLFSIISHDLRSPISTLKSLVDVLAQDQLSLDDGKKYLEKVSIQTNNVLVFLDDLLIWSKKQAENKPLELQKFKCKDVIVPVCELLEPSRKSKQIQLETKDLNNSVHVDKDAYAFIVRNLYHNAIKFTPENGVISISTAVRGNKVHTVIKDSGVGISKENIEKMLNKDVWFTKKGTSNESGTGFGISTCVEYLNDSQGELLIESEPGQGTEMRVILPSAN